MAPRALRNHEPVPKALVAALAALVALAIAQSSAAGPFPGPHPTRVVTSFRAQEEVGRQKFLVSWEAPGRAAERRGWSASVRPWFLETPARRVFARSRFDDGSVERRPYLARQDGFFLAELLREPIDFALAQARAGRRTLEPTTLGGRAALKTTVQLPANECAGLRRGRVTMWLSQRTLLPLRLTEVRGRRALTRSLAYKRVNGTLPASDFRLPRLGARPFRQDHGFRRAAPAHAASQLSYTPELPAVVPPGFTRQLSGWAPRSQRSGAEGTNPRYRELFAAVYRRGMERIDVTQRLAGARGWRVDPFSAECGFMFQEGANVNGVPAGYGIGPETVPHLFWRDGNLLYTVSGPFAKRDLIAIAESLAPIP